jgi:hypothetical protein
MHSLIKRSRVNHASPDEDAPLLSSAVALVSFFRDPSSRRARETLSCTRRFVTNDCRRCRLSCRRIASIGGGTPAGRGAPRGGPGARGPAPSAAMRGRAPQRVAQLFSRTPFCFLSHEPWRNDVTSDRAFLSMPTRDATRRGCAGHRYAPVRFEERCRREHRIHQPPEL